MTKTDNEIIAEFMDFELIDGKDKYMARWIKQTDGLLDPYAGPHRAEHLRFNASWDWLMPVILTAKKTPNSAEWNWDILNMYLCQCRIEDVHKEIVEFIKWYNTHKL